MRSIARSVPCSRGIAERYGDTARTGTRGPADAVHVVLRLRRQIEVDDVRDAGHVDASRGDVGRDQHACAAAAELFQRLLPRRLALVAVQGADPNAAALERFGDTIGGTLGAGEHDDPRQRRIGQQPIQQRPLAGGLPRNARAARSAVRPARCGRHPPAPGCAARSRQACRPPPAWSRRTATIAVPPAGQRRCGECRE